MWKRYTIPFLFNLLSVDLAKSASIKTGKTAKFMGPRAAYEFDNVRIGMADAIESAKSKSSGKLIEGALLKKNKNMIYKLLISENDKSISEIEVDATTGVVIQYKRNQ